MSNSMLKLQVISVTTTDPIKVGRCECILTKSSGSTVALTFEQEGVVRLEIEIGLSSHVWSSSSSSMIVSEPGTRIAVVWDGTATQLRFSEYIRPLLARSGSSAPARSPSIHQSSTSQPLVLLDLVDSPPLPTEAEESSRSSRRLGQGDKLETSDEAVTNLVALLQDESVVAQIQQLHRGLVRRWGADWVKHLTDRFPLLWQFE